MNRAAKSGNGYGYVYNCEQNTANSQTPDRSNRDCYEQPVRESQSQQSTRTWSREEVEAGLHPEHTSRTSDKKATNPNDPFWSPEQEIDFNAKPEYAERNYQETNDPYDHDWGFDRSENVSRQHLIHQKKNRLHMRIRKVPFQTNLRKIQDRLLRYSTEEKRNMKKTGSLICKGLLLATCRSGSLLD